MAPKLWGKIPVNSFNISPSISMWCKYRSDDCSNRSLRYQKDWCVLIDLHHHEYNLSSSTSPYISLPCKSFSSAILRRSQSSFRVPAKLKMQRNQWVVKQHIPSSMSTFHLDLFQANDRMDEEKPKANPPLYQQDATHVGPSLYF